MLYSSKNIRTLGVLASVLVMALLSGCQSNNDSTESSKDNDQQTVPEGLHGSDPSSKGWELVWSDEFDADLLDKSKWHAEVDCWGGGNDELQCYTDRPENAFAEDGILHIEAIEEQFSGPKLSESDPNYDPMDKSKTSPFTSARIQTKNKMSIRYGRIDVRAKVAAGQGMWSAIWMLPNDSIYGGWPASGEIDIMESLNPGIAKNEVHGTLHYGLPWPQWENKVQEFHMDASPSDNFHVYSTEWEEGEIRWYVDGKHYQTQSSEGWYNYIWQGQEKGFGKANPTAPFDEAFFLIMNVAVGGNWPGDPDRNWPKNRNMQVDYVRVYQCAESKDSDGKGCATIDSEVQLNTDFGAPAIESFSVYDDGPATLKFDVKAGTVTNTFSVGSQSVAYKNLDIAGHNGQVLDVQYSGNGSVSLQSNAHSEIAGYETGMQLVGGTSWSNNGEVEFDLLVKEASPDSKLTLVMGSGNNKSGSFEIAIPAVGNWQHVVVKVADLINSKAQVDGGLDLSNVKVPFELQYTGLGAHIQIDNITLECAYNSEPETWQLDQSCSISARKTPPKAIYAGINDVDWTVWDCCSGAEFELLDDPQSYQPVVEFSFGAAPTAPGFITPRPLDLSKYQGGKLEFEFKQTANPPEGSVWYVKLEGEITAGQVLLNSAGPVPNETWQQYSIPLSGKMASADLHNITRLLVFPDWGKAEGAAMRIKNIRFVAPQ
jgi:beta-glucanase (GH16 family)